MTAVDVVAVTFNSRPFLDAWADTIRSLEGVRTSVTVVDNASADGSADAVEALLPGARVLRNPSNEGFGRAANRAIAAGDAPYVFLCNVDLAIRPDFVARLAAVLEGDAGCGTACGKLLLDGTTIDSTGLQAYAPRLFEDRGHGRPDDGRFDHAGEVFGASGAAALYRRSMLDEIRVGGAVFDPEYFLYWEDIDLAWRARIAGWTARYQPAAVGTHTRGSASGRGARDIGAYSFAHRLFTIAKNDDPAIAPRAKIHAATVLMAAGLARAPRQWRAARRLLSRLRTANLKRSEVQGLRKVSPFEIESWFAPLSLAAWARERR